MKDKLLVDSNISEYLIDKYGAERVEPTSVREWIETQPTTQVTYKGVPKITDEEIGEPLLWKSNLPPMYSPFRKPMRDKGDDMITTIRPDDEECKHQLFCYILAGVCLASWIFMIWYMLK